MDDISGRIAKTEVTYLQYPCLGEAAENLAPQLVNHNARKRNPSNDESGDHMLRACLETTRGAAARNFGCGQGGLGRAQRPAAGCEERANAGHGQKTRRPEGFRGKGRLTSPCSRMLSELLRGGRAQRLLRRASPTGLFPENSAPRSFQTGSCMRTPPNR